MYECGQCSKSFKTQVNDIGLCLDCFERLKLLNNQDILIALMQCNQASEYMDQVIGIPNAPKNPKYDVTAYAETIRRQLVMNNIRIQNSNIGVINTGVIDTLNQNIQALGTLNKDMAYELSNLTKVVLESNFTDEQKNDLIDNISFIADQYARPEGKRNKSVLLSTVRTISTMISSVKGIADLWESIKPMLGL